MAEKYRKKPVVIEARRVPTWADHQSAIEFVNEAVDLANWTPPDDIVEGIYIPTL